MLSYDSVLSVYELEFNSSYSPIPYAEYTFNPLKSNSSFKRYISLVFLDYEKMKQCLKDLERDTDIIWYAGSSPTDFIPSKECFYGKEFYELRINQPGPECSTPYLTYGGDIECLRMLLQDYNGFVFLIK